MKNSTKIEVLIIFLLAVLLGIMVFGVFRSNEGTNIVSEDKEIAIPDFNVEYLEEDLTETTENYTAKITLDDNTIVDGKGVIISNNTITINSAGIYYITGTLSDGNIVIDAGKEDLVRLVLDNVNITSSKTAPINGIKASKLIITLARDSENTITDSSSYSEFTDIENQEPDSAIFTKTDLVINGTGKLVINANYKDAIASKDGLKIINSSIEINSEDDGIRGKDYVAIKDAKITINSKGDSIKSTNDSDEGLGYILIDSGDISINSGDDGIHAYSGIKINGGNINILDSYEGIESAYIEINGGTINVIASDDGINISSGSDSSMEGMPGQNPFGNSSNSNRKLVINGGDIKVNSTGDGLDSNGSIYINGGKVLVVGTTSGGNGALDYDSECVVAGGELIVYGSTGMWQNPTSNSTQYSITYYSSGDSDDEIQIKDSSENIVSSFTTERAYGAIIISNSNIKQGETYTMYKNGSEVGSITVDSIVSTYGTSGGMNGGGMMDQGEMQRGSRYLQN